MATLSTQEVLGGVLLGLAVGFLFFGLASLQRTLSSALYVPSSIAARKRRFPLGAILFGLAWTAFFALRLIVSPSTVSLSLFLGGLIFLILVLVVPERALRYNGKRGAGGREADSDDPTGGSPVARLLGIVGALAATLGFWVLFTAFGGRAVEASPSFWAGPVAFVWILVAIGLRASQFRNTNDAARRERLCRSMMLVSLCFGIVSLSAGLVEFIFSTKTVFDNQTGPISLLSIVLGVTFIGASVNGFRRTKDAISLRF